MTLVHSTTVTEQREERKARGAFYTPAALTAFVAAWAIRSGEDRVLEPSAGDGAFVAAVADRFAELGVDDLSSRLTAVELVPEEAAKVARLARGGSVVARSFFEVAPDSVRGTTAVVGNPPYIRYHAFTGAARRDGLARALDQGVELSGLASSWAHFVVHASSFLPASGGRLGLVLPAELLHTEYAAPVRSFLLRRFQSVSVIAFDRPAFADAQVDAVVLLADDTGPAGLRVIRCSDVDALAGLVVGGSVADPGLERWSGQVASEAADVYQQLVRSSRFATLGSIAGVDIGVVTGANGFFVVDEARRVELALPRAALTPIVDRPRALRGMRVRRGETKWLLDLRRRPDLATDECVADYLAAGVERAIDKGYKTSHRVPWYGVPVPRGRADLFLPYMSHRAPRLISNGVRALSTNLVHAVRRTKLAPPTAAIAASSLSSVTGLSAEIVGRPYGGGVLKLETREAERLLLPKPSPAEVRWLVAQAPLLDRLVRDGDHDAASLIVDRGLGIDRDVVWAATEAFRSRRLGR